MGGAGGFLGVWKRGGEVKENGCESSKDLKKAFEDEKLQ